MIDFEHVSKEYKKGGRLALEDINLHVDDGEFVFLVGPSGSGKSTIAKLLLKYYEPEEEIIRIDGWICVRYVSKHYEKLVSYASTTT